jgi:hypothetical protein
MLVRSEPLTEVRQIYFFCVFVLGWRGAGVLPILSFFFAVLTLKLGPTESPFVVRRGASFYLFSGSWDGYSDTRVFVSTDPFNFGSTVNGTAQQVGEITSHAPEVVRDIAAIPFVILFHFIFIIFIFICIFLSIVHINGDWYISRCGWGTFPVRISRSSPFPLSHAPFFHFGSPKLLLS